MEKIPAKKLNPTVLICISAILCCLILASAVVFSALSKQQADEKMMAAITQIAEGVKSKDVSSPTTVTYDAKNKYSVLTSSWPECLVLNQETGKLLFINAKDGIGYTPITEKNKYVSIEDAGYLK